MSKYTSDFFSFSLLPDRPIQQGRSGFLSFISSPLLCPPTVPSALLLITGEGIFRSPISPEDATIHNWSAAASHPA
ncbi:hypothetical protein CXU09_04040 [Akkermansia muciniphila]|uniref:Uncharacterized protein n=1 Tax=Akkermansia muciniphila TaxID=239935 RepID=A0AAP8NLH9_9BACT|nr:hypothetical protein CXU09_04040 [Akkermansia muciniphila]